jgi:hypothetical protein
MASVYVRVWEYQVAADHIDAFLAAYGAEGDWARLFRTGRGFLGTELFRRTDDEARFVQSIDGKTRGPGATSSRDSARLMTDSTRR